MTEDPIKIFAKRSERYPEPSEADLVQGGARAALAAIPVIGGTVTEVLSMVLAPAVSRRRDEWFKDLADGLDELEEKFKEFRVEHLAGNEVFVSAAIQATRAAAATHQAEKRDALRNALLNTAIGRAPDEDQIQMFFRYIEELTVWHLNFLRLFQSPQEYLQSVGVRFGGYAGGFPQRGSRVFNYTMGGPSVVVEMAFPELAGKAEFYGQLAADLRARGMLSSADFLHTTMSANGMLSKQTTAIADAFIEFIKSPLQP